jgi:murein DD-endopeptidase MepM/ murein hydrolase activator NlpD
MKKLLTILIIFKTLSCFSQDTIRLSGEDSVLFIKLAENFKKLDSLQNLTDSISRSSDSIYLSIDKAYPIEMIDFNYFELQKAKLNFDSLYSKYIKSDNFPDILPIDSIENHRIIGFGNKIHPIYKIAKFHQGIDIPTLKGKSVKSTISGVITTKLEKKSGYGNYIIIDAGNQTKILYAHLDTIIVHQGDKVEKGQIVGTVGNSGLSTGNHLHYEIFIEDKPINPIFTIFDFISKVDFESIYTRNVGSLD